MTKLDDLWVEVADYQSKANDNGHGDTWAEMCRLRTVEACRAASRRSYLDVYACYAADALANAAKYSATEATYATYAANAFAAADAATADAALASAAYAAEYAEYWMQKAIKHINQAIELAEKQHD
jgi:hypothetical protein